MAYSPISAIVSPTRPTEPAMPVSSRARRFDRVSKASAVDSMRYTGTLASSAATTPRSAPASAAGSPMVCATSVARDAGCCANGR